MSNLSNPTHITSDDDTTPTSPHVTSLRSPRLFRVTADRTEEITSSDESEPFEEEPRFTVSTGSTQRERVPSFRPYRLHPEGSLMMLTPRKTTRPSKGKRVVPPTAKPTDTPSRRVQARRWGWVPDRIQTWREEEGVPSIHEVGESSTAIPIPPLTREPVHHTIPVLVARMVHYESRINELDFEQEETLGTLQQEVTAAENVIARMTHTISDMREDITELRDENTTLRQQVDQSNQRTTEIEQRMTEMEQSLERADAIGNAITKMAKTVTQIDHFHE